MRNFATAARESARSFVVRRAEAIANAARPGGASGRVGRDARERPRGAAGNLFQAACTARVLLCAHRHRRRVPYGARKGHGSRGDSRAGQHSFGRDALLHDDALVRLETRARVARGRRCAGRLVRAGAGGGGHVCAILSWAAGHYAALGFGHPHEVYCGHGRRRFGPGQGSDCLVARRADALVGLSRDIDQDRPIPERGRGHDVAV